MDPSGDYRIGCTYPLRSYLARLTGLWKGLILLFVIAISSLAFIRRRFFVAFTVSHDLLAFGTLSSLLLHVWLVHPPGKQLEGKIPLSISAFLWVLVLLLRWNWRISVRGNITKLGDHAIETSLMEASNGVAAIIKVDLPRDVRIYPGAYFYVFFRELSVWRRFRGFPMMAYSWEPPRRASASAKSLTFLVQDRPTLSRILSQDSTALILDGPYGQNPGLGRFNTVVLVAEGIGISGILPFALSLARRRNDDRITKEEIREVKTGIHADSTRRRDENVREVETRERKAKAELHLDNTRRLTLLWAMDENCQIDWIKELASVLTELDGAMNLLHVWIYEPAQATSLAGTTAEETARRQEESERRQKEAAQKLGINARFTERHWRVSFVPRRELKNILENQIGWELQAVRQNAVMSMPHPFFIEVLRV
jgi:hypothetical protein